ncbi:MAG: hypothetical protein ABF743_01795 [Schleiferilactobacillus perolens]|jgi:hypothetical protein|uniref:hypothetical protein n=1 Tax=Schleiferilactobacillus perolens TaxID=100468 RepID=UPI0039ED1DB1|nr:hypothetical protein [Schleiferilactobacillus harbinensis]MCI1912691.1 hypothetical protein [Schleiferilactobacillus harbinensis]
MNYELVNTINPGLADWPAMKARVQKENGKVLTLASAPGLLGVLKQENVQGLNVIDELTKRKYHAQDYLFFDRVPVPTATDIIMQSDGVITLIYDGETIGYVTTYAGTRRAVKEVRYINPDNTLDNIEEYAFDGSHYTTIFYYNNEPQQIQFFNNQGQVCLRFFLYEKVVNLITIEDPATGKVLQRYDTMTDFYIARLQQILNAGDRVTIDYMGVELFALAKTASHNVLHLVESPFDENDQIRGNLKMILDNSIPYIQEVEMSQAAYNALALRNYPLTKITVVKDQ